jgi:FkbM family methyltransferase
MKSLVKIYRYIKFLFNVLVGNDIFIRNDINISRSLHGNMYASFIVSPQYLDSNSIVYSFGVGTDISFDLDVIGKYNCNIYCFDPTPDSIAWINSIPLPEKLKFYRYGLSDKNEKVKFYKPKNSSHISHSIINNENFNSDEYIYVEMKDLETIMAELGHKFIDILKLDIEGSEYKVLRSILLKEDIFIKQIVIEFHHRFGDIGIQQTIDSIRLLQDKGYLLFAITDTKEEYSFIHKSVII